MLMIMMMMILSPSVVVVVVRVQRGAQAIHFLAHTTIRA
jgi:hypothetical protein